MDYQIWCGPAMGAFNDWVRGSFLEPYQNRDAVQIALNLLEGAAVITRAEQLRSEIVELEEERKAIREQFVSTQVYLQGLVALIEPTPVDGSTRHGRF